MAILHYAYSVLKMPCSLGVISIRGDIKRTYDYNNEICKIADRLISSVELQELKKVMVQFSLWTRSCPRPRHLRCPSS
jgi:hypothetical protein